MGGPNLEIFKFALYIFTPIATMLYFGTNLDNRFAVPDFWPKPSETHRIPFERDEVLAELERLKARRLRVRDERLKGLADAKGEAAVKVNGVAVPRGTYMKANEGETGGREEKSGEERPG